MINKVILIGNLGKDPEVRHLESGVAVGRFSLATNENYRDNSGEWKTITTWHDVVVWRQLAERAEQQLRKGSLVYVEGKIQKRKWTDRDGNERLSTEVVANLFRALERRENSSSFNDQSFPTAQDAPASAGSSDTSSPAGMEVDDDLPF